jgi:TonB-dependent receptor
MIDGSQIDASLQQVTGSSFRNSYMKAGVDQAQIKGSWQLPAANSVDFGVGLTNVSNRTAYAFVQRDTWGGASSPADYPDSVWHADTLSQYFSGMSGHNDPRLFNQWFTWDFNTVRDLASKASGNDSLYRAPTDFTTDRRTKEDSKNAYVQYNQDWELGIPMSLNAGIRYEQTDVTSSALVPTATGVRWGSNNELSVLFGSPGFTELKGSYRYFLPSIDYAADLTSKVKLRLSYGETIARPGWGDIQGGQVLDQLARVDGGTGSQGNPGLKPLLSHDTDASVEWYYAKSSYLSVGFFRKNVANWIGHGTVTETPFNLNTPIGGTLYNAALESGCVAGDATCIRNYIFRNYDGTNGVVKGLPDGQGNETGTITGQPGDPIMPFKIAVPVNQRSASLHGFEFNIQHTFGNSGFGLGANYTFVLSGLKYDNGSLGEQFALVGLSNSANVVGFFENDNWNLRMAYNWRGQFLAATKDAAGDNPVYTEPYGQLDATLGYHFTKNLSVELDAINLNDGIQRQHSRTTNELESITQNGRRYAIGARYKF